jgi:hypothetical protein
MAGSDKAAWPMISWCGAKRLGLALSCGGAVRKNVTW